jgi:hypothetical protein
MKNSAYDPLDVLEQSGMIPRTPAKKRKQENIILQLDDILKHSVADENEFDGKKTDFNLADLKNFNHSSPNPKFFDKFMEFISNDFVRFISASNIESSYSLLLSNSNSRDWWAAVRSDFGIDCQILQVFGAQVVRTIFEIISSFSIVSSTKESIDNQLCTLYNNEKLANLAKTWQARERGIIIQILLKETREWLIAQMNQHVLLTHIPMDENEIRIEVHNYFGWAIRELREVAWHHQQQEIYKEIFEFAKKLQKEQGSKNVHNSTCASSETPIFCLLLNQGGLTIPVDAIVPFANQLLNDIFQIFRCRELNSAAMIVGKESLMSSPLLQKKFQAAVSELMPSGISDFASECSRKILTEKVLHARGKQYLLEFNHKFETDSGISRKRQCIRSQLKADAVKATVKFSSK